MEYENQYQHIPKTKYDCLLFDVDDTLYPLNSGLSDHVTKNIIEYMITKLGIAEDKVPEMCVRLYKEYGTTMAGLRAIGYDFDYDDCHSFVHGRLPYEILKPDPVLKSLLQSLPIRKVIFSNANEEHVARVLGRLGLMDCFEGVICFETLNPINKTKTPDNYEDGADLKGSKQSTDFIEKFCETNQLLQKSPVVCKPFEDAFEQAFKIAKINPQRTLFFDDSIRNIQTGKDMGLHTIWVGSSHRTKSVDYALESIHNMREALPELREAFETMEEVHYSEMVAIETPVRA
ncbi:Suppressor of disruption of TFIIS like [Actinidia chinensis var. chinensis]|uniref:Suppressor of disruption of TFIIS like n=1 Tax=Actinidia chinensis var. chinensis TaxID=1590841 RepID=A0A2R6PPX2_ACTCC|nr:Suppressor of disruption of TFIIS like [Actinidia chinensis var. chinensis]